MCIPAIPAALGATLGGTASAGQLFTTSLLLGGATQGFQYYGQQQQADSAAKFQREQAIATNRQIIDTARRANQSFVDQTKQLNIQQSQRQAQASQQLQEKQKQTRKAQATARVAAGEAGVSGLSVDALLSDYEAQSALFESSIQTNLANSQAALQTDISGLRTQRDQRATSVSPFVGRDIQGPSLLQPLLGFGGDFVSASDRFLRDPNKSGRVNRNQS